MQTFILTAMIFLIVAVAMSIGYIVQRKTIAGSCGGLGSVGIDKVCSCENPCEKRKEKMRKEEAWKENRIL